MRIHQKKRANGDLCDRYHHTKGDTSQGRWLTVLFCVLGIMLSAAEIFLYIRFREVLWLMLAVCLIDLIYAYVEMSHLYIRKYWFRYHRRLAVVLTLVIYWILLFSLLLAVSKLSPLVSFTWHWVYLPFVLMPSMIVVAFLLFGLLFVIGG